MKQSEALLAVVIIRIDHGKRLVHAACGGEYSLSRPERFHASLRQFVPLRHVRQLLICIFDIHDLRYTVSDDAPEVRLKVSAYDKYDLVEACLHRVMDGIVHDDLAARTYGLQLLDAAAESGADAGSHNNKCCVHDVSPLLPTQYLLMSSSVSSGVTETSCT